ncbi:hypothetical protein HOO65_010606 [Ceratocystis lukuohia]|uniref:Biogenesis of lysosome-related organelles complex 1 subunit KXD1 n=1 Tax=Ceratocystis lukuohia TaxID=2019550 RepID=A0ABR4MSJ8_9PEZI
MAAHYYPSGYSLPISSPSKASHLQYEPYPGQAYYTSPSEEEEDVYSTTSGGTSYTSPSFGTSSSRFSSDLYGSGKYASGRYGSSGHTPDRYDSSSSSSYKPELYGSSNYTYGSRRSGSGNSNTGMSARNADFPEYMSERASGLIDPAPLDQGIATQARTSGKLNGKHRQLADMQQQAAGRLARFRERYTEGLRDAQEVQQDLEWTQQKLQSLKSKAQRKHGREYAMARSQYCFAETE